MTWHLHGSLPKSLYPEPSNTNAGKAFVWVDRCLDTARTGPMYLRMPEVAELIVSALRSGHEDHMYELRAWALMPNHVHVLFSPHEKPQVILRRLKGSTARKANLLLGRAGQPFWQTESYDHLVMNPSELENIVAYIEHNPVKAGLAASSSEYRWCSAWTPD